MIASMMVSNGTLATFNWLRCVNEALVTEMCRRDEAPQPIIWLIFGDIRLVYEFCGKTVLCAFDRVVKVADCYLPLICAAIRCGFHARVRYAKPLLIRCNPLLTIPPESLRARHTFLVHNVQVCVCTFFGVCTIF
jgi:hypothetical protein